jgi:hypothetical protein
MSPAIYFGLISGIFSSIQKDKITDFLDDLLRDAWKNQPQLPEYADR